MKTPSLYRIQHPQDNRKSVHFAIAFTYGFTGVPTQGEVSFLGIHEKPPNWMAAHGFRFAVKEVSLLHTHEIGVTIFEWWRQHTYFGICFTGSIHYQDTLPFRSLGVSLIFDCRWGYGWGRQAILLFSLRQKFGSSPIIRHAITKQ